MQYLNYFVEMCNICRPVPHLKSAFDEMERYCIIVSGFYCPVVCYATFTET